MSAPRIPEAGSVRGDSPGGGRRFWRVAVPLVLLAALAWFVWSERTTLSRVGEAPPRDLLIIAGLFVVAHFINSAEFWLLHVRTGASLGLFENWMVFTAGHLGNYLPAQVGTVYRFRYMQVVHEVPVIHTAAIQGANLVITIAGAALVGLAGVIGMWLYGGAGLSILMLLLFASMGVVAVLFALVPLPPFRGRTGRIARLWRRFHDGFEQVRRMPGTGISLVALEVGKYLATAWRIQVTFSLIDIHQPLWFFLVLAPAAGIASFISVTPAALGFREAFLTGTAAAMGLEATEGLLGATVDRAVMMVTFLILGGIGFLVTLRRLRTAPPWTPPTESRMEGCGDARP